MSSWRGNAYSDVFNKLRKTNGPRRRRYRTNSDVPFNKDALRESKKNLMDGADADAEDEQHSDQESTNEESAYQHDVDQGDDHQSVASVTDSNQETIEQQHNNADHDDEHTATTQPVSLSDANTLTETNNEDTSSAIAIDPEPPISSEPDTHTAVEPADLEQDQKAVDLPTETHEQEENTNSTLSKQAQSNHDEQKGEEDISMKIVIETHDATHVQAVEDAVDDELKVNDTAAVHVASQQLQVADSAYGDVTDSDHDSLTDASSVYTEDEYAPSNRENTAELLGALIGADNADRIDNDHDIDYKAICEEIWNEKKQDNQTQTEQTTEIKQHAQDTHEVDGAVKDEEHADEEEKIAERVDLTKYKLTKDMIKKFALQVTEKEEYAAGQISEGKHRWMCHRFIAKFKKNKAVTKRDAHGKEIVYFCNSREAQPLVVECVRYAMRIRPNPSSTKAKKHSKGKHKHKGKRSKAKSKGKQNQSQRKNNKKKHSNRRT